MSFPRPFVSFHSTVQSWSYIASTQGKFDRVVARTNNAWALIYMIGSALRNWNWPCGSCTEMEIPEDDDYEDDSLQTRNYRRRCFSLPLSLSHSTDGNRVDDEYSMLYAAISSLANLALSLGFGLSADVCSTGRWLGIGIVIAVYGLFCLEIDENYVYIRSLKIAILCSLLSE